MMADLICDDVKRWAAEYDGPPFHALLCDCPYEMEFMGKGWDGSGIAFDSEMWKALAAHLHPGAFMFVMAGTINDDLISVALRQAGLRKFHRMLGWAYGSGFPKSTRLDTQIDAAAGAEREVIGDGINADAKRKHHKKHNGKSGITYYGAPDGPILTAPATPLARTWSSHRYGGQALKPAIETVLIFQKPYNGKPVDSITATGAGALWIEGGRIGIEEISYSYSSTSDGGVPNKGISGTIDGRDPHKIQLRISKNSELPPIVSSGRWPPNFYLTHHPNCNGACVDGCPVKAIGEQSDILGNAWRPNRDRETPVTAGIFGGNKLGETYPDSGTAARFFLNADWNAETWERLETSDPVLYTAKAGRTERDEGLSEFPLKNVRPSGNGGGIQSIWNGENGDEEWKDKNPSNPARNSHSTVKPIALTRWLATLLLPPAAYAPRRLLIPFAGVASEMIGAHLAGWEEIVGIELEKEHVDIGRARLEWWGRQMAFNLET